MTDKVQLIKQEIERLKTQNETYLDKEYAESTKWYKHGAYDTCFQLLNFINSLPEEPTKEDLEEAANQHSKQVFHGLLVEDNITAFKAGAEWQKQKDQETIELAEDHAMLAGMNRMKEEMMENAIESIVEDWCGDFPEVTIPLNPQDFKTGDKVKIIIVKEE